MKNGEDAMTATHELYTIAIPSRTRPNSFYGGYDIFFLSFRLTKGLADIGMFVKDGGWFSVLILRLFQMR